MQANGTVKSALLALVLTLVAITSWEFALRHKGNAPDYDDNAELWANNRAMVYEPANKATVFIGSSRIKYDIDIPTWEGITGTHAIQLAMVGSSPRPFLADLANDPNFKGKLVMDITEVLFFSQAPYVLQSPTDGISFYKKRTPAQKASFALGETLESKLVFLNRNFFSLNALLDDLHVPDRPGVYQAFDFPIEFGVTDFNRQTKMLPKFVADSNLLNRVTAIWGRLAKANNEPPMAGAQLNTYLQSVKSDVDKIKARGGDVIFTRTPSSGPFLAGEKMGYPKKAYWDKLLAVTQCKGVYFTDYPELAHFTCPEFSHLQPRDAVLYTKGLINILKTEKGWPFN